MPSPGPDELQRAPAKPASAPQQNAGPQAMPGVTQVPTPAFPTVDIAPAGDVSAGSPQLVAAAKGLKEQLAVHPGGHASVRVYWSTTSQKDAQKKAESVRSALVSLGVPAAKIQATSMSEVLVGSMGQDNHAVIDFIDQQILLPSLGGLGVPGLTPSLPSPPPGPGPRAAVNPQPPGFWPIQPIPTLPPGPSFADGKFVANMKKAFSTVVDGIGVDQASGFAKVSVKGPTVGLRKGPFSASGTVSFSGTYKVEAKYGDIKFVGSIGAERWEMSLSFPGETPTPDLSSLAAVFSKAEASFRSIAASAASFKHIDDVSRIGDEIKPHMQPVVDAVTAAGGIAETQAKRLNAGISAFGPGISPVKGISPAGNAVVLTLTYSF